MVSILIYKGWGYFKAQTVEPLKSEPYLVVYGRDSCGFTQQTIRELKKASVKFEYLSVDDKSVADSLHFRMESKGINTRRYLLPVVDLNNSFSIRPENKDLVARAKSLSL